MSIESSSTKGSERLTAKDAYLAMYYFVQAYWNRGGRRDGSVTLLLSALGPSADPQNPEAMQTNDPAFWDDWLSAVKEARREGVPPEL
jgi:hypothetical protein